MSCFVKYSACVSFPKRFLHNLDGGGYKQDHEISGLFSPISVLYYGGPRFDLTVLRGVNVDDVCACLAAAGEASEPS